jgi:hypothetical protein
LVRASPSQLPKSAAHAIAQVPARQAGVPLAALHAAPHAPQCAGVDESAVSQPLAALPSQLP